MFAEKLAEKLLGGTFANNLATDQDREALGQVGKAVGILQERRPDMPIELVAYKGRDENHGLRMRLTGLVQNRRVRKEVELELMTILLREVCPIEQAWVPEVKFRGSNRFKTQVEGWSITDKVSRVAMVIESPTAFLKQQQELKPALESEDVDRMPPPPPPPVDSEVIPPFVDLEYPFTRQDAKGKSRGRARWPAAAAVLLLTAGVGGAAAWRWGGELPEVQLPNVNVAELKLPELDLRNRFLGLFRPSTLNASSNGSAKGPDDPCAPITADPFNINATRVNEKTIRRDSTPPDWVATRQADCRAQEQKQLAALEVTPTSVEAAVSLREEEATPTIVEVSNRIPQTPVNLRPVVTATPVPVESSVTVPPTVIAPPKLEAPQVKAAEEPKASVGVPPAAEIESVPDAQPTVLSEAKKLSKPELAEEFLDREFTVRAGGSIWGTLESEFPEAFLDTDETPNGWRIGPTTERAWKIDSIIKRAQKNGQRLDTVPKGFTFTIRGLIGSDHEIGEARQDLLAQGANRALGVTPLRS